MRNQGWDEDKWKKALQRFNRMEGGFWDSSVKRQETRVIPSDVTSWGGVRVLHEGRWVWRKVGGLGTRFWDDFMGVDQKQDL